MDPAPLFLAVFPPGGSCTAIYIDVGSRWTTTLFLAIQDLRRLSPFQMMGAGRHRYSCWCWPPRVKTKSPAF
jgi:hypothetical protein